MQKNVTNCESPASPGDNALPDARVKICGITNIDDARMAAEAGADFLGYILYPRSPRYVAPPRVRTITNMIRVEFPNVQHVGVFVDASVDGVCRTVDLAGLEMAQLHGAEIPSFCGKLLERGVSHIKVMRFGVGAPPVNWAEFPTASFYLCDTFETKTAGGTGHAFDHTLLPLDLPKERSFLAGGLTQMNVGAAVAAVHPYAVDVSTGVEISPGVKSAEKVKAFVAAVKPKRDQASKPGT